MYSSTPRETGAPFLMSPRSTPLPLMRGLRGFNAPGAADSPRGRARPHLYDAALSLIVVIIVRLVVRRMHVAAALALQVHQDPAVFLLSLVRRRAVRHIRYVFDRHH